MRVNPVKMVSQEIPVPRVRAARTRQGVSLEDFGFLETVETVLLEVMAPVEAVVVQVVVSRPVAAMVMTLEVEAVAVVPVDALELPVRVQPVAVAHSVFSSSSPAISVPCLY